MKIKPASKTKTIKITCPSCKRRFYATFSLIQPNATGIGKVVTRCLYCKGLSLIEVPNKYINEARFKKQIARIRKQFNIV
jgi:C4-type Zn-finger protein